MNGVYRRKWAIEIWPHTQKLKKRDLQEGCLCLKKGMAKNQRYLSLFDVISGY
jgi:hypothetical protein